MPALLLRFLPHIGIVLAIIGAVAWIDHKGYQRARKDAEHERLVTAIIVQKNVRALETSLAAQLSNIDGDLGRKIEAIDVIHRTVIQPAISKELSSEVRYSDPAAGISASLLDTLNAARGVSACSSRPDGGIECTLSAPATDPGPNHR